MMEVIDEAELLKMLLEKRLLKLLIARDLLARGEEEQAMQILNSAIKDCPKSDKWLVDAFVQQLEGFSQLNFSV